MPLHIFHDQEKPRIGNSLRDIILGGQDGLVNVLGVVLGVSAVTADKSIIIATGLAATFAESISMGAVAYTSFLTEKNRYQKELKNEQEEIRNIPAKEKEEIRQIYAAKGFSGQLLDEIVNTICSNKKVWVNVMMNEELHLAKVSTSTVLKTAVVVGVAAFLGSLIPLWPFIVFSHQIAFILALVISALALFAVGSYQAVTLVGDWKKSGLQMVIIGLGAALIGFSVARLFNTT
ncbi:VIT1/CCC1 transporter family protein [Candidatus Daviesbacteria bacterium]|nr:VIT1/CCC1 transporter family protein [Candidatus Daviesbacteria bacterium]